MRLSGCCACCKEYKPRVIRKTDVNLQYATTSQKASKQVKEKAKMSIAQEEVVVTLQYHLKNIRSNQRSGSLTPRQQMDNISLAFTQHPAP